MKLILQVVGGPSKGRQVPMQSGERVRLGSGDIADVSIPSDPAMSAVHFELLCGVEDCRLRGLSGSEGITVNGQTVTDASISDGDEIVAGQSTFKVVFKGAPRLTPETDAQAEGQPGEEVEPRPTADELCKLVNLKPPSLKLFQPELEAEEFIDRLVEHGLYSDAIKLLAYYLPKREAVWWCLCGVESVSAQPPSDAENAALDATRQWLQDPTEANRRSAMAIAEELNMEHAACYVAASAFYSEGSMAPEGMAEVAPPPTLTGQVVAATLPMVAADGDPATAKDRYRELIRIGKQVLSGELALPEQTPEPDSEQETADV